MAGGLSSNVGIDNLLRVSGLIDFNNVQCKLDDIAHVIDGKTREAILSIPLSLNWPVHNLFWLHTRDGRYTVKFGYWLGSLDGRENADIIPSEPDDVLWKTLWNLFCPPKLKHFIWRACVSSLVVNEERHQRHIDHLPFVIDAKGAEIHLSCFGAL